MTLFQVLLLLTTVLLQFVPANGQDPEFYSLSTSRTEVQTEIVNEHNEKRRSVFPSASNMLKMKASSPLRCKPLRLRIACFSGHNIKNDMFPKCIQWKKRGTGNKVCQKWSSEAAANAQKWANGCTLSHSLSRDREISFSHCGENLFMSTQPEAWSQAIQAWFNEIHDFTYGKGPNRPGAVVGHYTQLAWYSSYLVGCGMAYCPRHSLKYFYVCQYCPSGNIKSRRNTPYLQGKPCDSCPNDCDNGLCTNTCEYMDIYSNCEELVKMVGCNHKITKEGCQASCKCSNKIF